MDKKQKDKIFMIVALLTSLIGLVFICMNIFSNNSNNTYLSIGLSCVAISNILIIIKNISNK